MVNYYDIRRKDHMERLITIIVSLIKKCVTKNAEIITTYSFDNLFSVFH